MTLSVEGVRNFLDLAWKEISSWGSGIDFSFYDHLQDRIDQLEQELARARRRPNDLPSELTMPQLDECW
jgi:hypothetical protein